MTIVVTGATGHLGRLILDSLLRDGTPPADIVAAGRDAEKLAALEATGVRTARIDFEEPATLAEAFAGADTLVLVSASTPGRRVAQHSAAIDAAKAAGVTRIVYTSAPKATTSDLVLAPEHKATEEYLQSAGVPFTILRNNWYHENYAQAVGQARQTGRLVGSTGTGRIASASRADYADAAAAVVTSDGHENAVYELTGDSAWDFAEFAAIASRVFDQDIAYDALTPDDHAALLSGLGLDEGTVGFVVALDGNIRDGDLAETSRDLATLIGRRTTTLEEYLVGLK